MHLFFRLAISVSAGTDYHTNPKIYVEKKILKKFQSKCPLLFYTRTVKKFEKVHKKLSERTLCYNSFFITDKFLIRVKL